MRIKRQQHTIEKYTVSLRGEYRRYVFPDDGRDGKSMYQNNLAVMIST